MASDPPVTSNMKLRSGRCSDKCKIPDPLFPGQIQPERRIEGIVGVDQRRLLEHSPANLCVYRYGYTALAAWRDIPVKSGLAPSADSNVFDLEVG